LQQRSQVYFDVAWIGAKSLFGGPLAEAARLQVVKKLFAEIGDEALKPPADSGFVNMKDTCDLGEGLAIKKVGGEEKAVLRGETLESSRYGVSETSEFGGEWSDGSCRRGDVQGAQRSLAMSATVMVDVPLRERGAKPAKERAATGVGGQRGAALAIDLTESVELGVKRVRKIMAESGGAGDSDGGLSKRNAVEAHKALPGDLTSKSAGVGQCELREAEGTKEGCFLGGVGVSAKRKTIVEFGANRGERDAELFERKVADLRFRA
jgi:hypothetical protein